VGLFRKKTLNDLIPIHPDNIGNKDWAILLEAGTIVGPSPQRIRIARLLRLVEHAVGKGQEEIGIHIGRRIGDPVRFLGLDRLDHAEEPVLRPNRAATPNAKDERCC